MRRFFCFALVTLLGSGCVYYDHRWVQEHRARKERERKAEAAAQLASSGGPPVEADRVARVRIYANGAYRQSHFDWTREMKAVVEGANLAWIGATGTRLEVDDTIEWDAGCDVAGLESCLATLMALDPGEDVDWVIGLVGSVPRFTQRFDDLGLAALPGKHLILRGFADAEEQDALAREFPGTRKEKLDEIYRMRKRHKAQVVLLHELGHTLGALHVRERGAIMSAVYDHRASHFSKVTAGMLLAGTRDRFAPRDSPHAYKRGYLAVTDGPAWEADERLALLASLEAMDASASARGLDTQGLRGTEPRDGSTRAAHSLVLSGSEDELLAGLEESSRAVYRDAVARLKQGDAVGAWTTLEPLIEAAPECRAVQHLGCNLALRLGQVERARQACPRSVTSQP